MNRLFPWLASLGALLLITGCGDPLRPRAQVPVLTDTLVAFALTGTPMTAPSALSTPSLVLLPPRNAPGTFDVEFELVFDIDQVGQARLYPASRIGLSSRRIGFRNAEVPFEEVLEAPRGGYVRDTVWVATVGQAVIVEAEVNHCGQFSLSRFMYSKLVVDSVRADSRLIYFRAVSDPNCGFRSFVEGIPES